MICRVAMLFVAALSLMPWVAACSSSAEGVASPEVVESTDAVGTSFDPCTDVSDAEVEAFGLDPGSRAASANQGIGLSKGCGWQNEDVMLDVLVTTQTVDVLAARSTFTGVTRLTVSGRDAAQLVIDDGYKDNCAIAVTSERTAVIAAVSVAFNAIGTVDPCATALDIATTLAPTLPE